MVERSNGHPRDSKIIFHPFKHIYEIDNDFEYSSASEVAKLLFKEFDLDGQAQRLSIQRNKSIQEIKNGFIRDKELGIQLHLDIEKWFENNSYRPTKETLTEFNFFVDYYQQELGGQYPYRTEWAIYDNLNKIAGTVDLVVRKPDGSFAIYDWKRTKRFYKSRDLTGAGMCSKFPDGNLSIYTIQAHIYKKILKDFYGINVTEVFLVQLHPQPYNNTLQANPVNISDAHILAQYSINMDELIDDLFKLVKRITHR
ncbi:MAG: PD-(D/E)XK nuclease family protein [Bacteroidetes bacterium]|nr:PD-(D/E)XK nuclease family protein [Bacteroidota bacterium]